MAVRAVMGFVVCALAFGASGIWFGTLSQHSHIKIMQFLYYITSFFGQVRLAMCRCCDSCFAILLGGARYGSRRRCVQ